jgi:hypothetical protein
MTSFAFMAAILIRDCATVISYLLVDGISMPGVVLDCRRGQSAKSIQSWCAGTAPADGSSAIRKRLKQEIGLGHDEGPSMAGLPVASARGRFSPPPSERDRRAFACLAAGGIMVLECAWGSGLMRWEGLSSSFQPRLNRFSGHPNLFGFPQVFAGTEATTIESIALLYARNRIL